MVIRRHARWMLVGLLAYAQLSWAQTAEPRPVNTIPLEKCESQQVLMEISWASTLNAGEAQKRVADRYEALAKISDRHVEAKHDRPLNESLTKSEVAEFEGISAQIGVTNMLALAESRRDRDAMFMARMLDAVDTLRRGGQIPAGDPDAAKPFAALYWLASALSDEHPRTKNVGECSVDLALQVEDGRKTAAATQALQASPELRELLDLRAKYRMAANQSWDSVVVAPADAERVKLVSQRVSSAVDRVKLAHGSMDAIRYFADMSQLRYDELRQDVLELGATRDTSEFGALQAKHRQALSPEMQKVWDVWNQVDNAVPSDQAKTLEMTARIAAGKQ